MRLRALLVDDEINILKNLKQVIQWEEMNIEICAMAKTGKEALEAAKTFYPDIILCDIRMPVMDGITFIEHVREMELDCEVLLLTGYQDFEYARSAIRLNVKDYVLKPINYEGLQESIAQIALEIRANRQHKDQEKKSWGKVLTLAYEKILFDVLMDYSSVSGKHIAENEEIALDDLVYIMFLLDIEQYSHKSLDWSEKERKLWNFAVRNVIQEALQEYRIKYAVVQMREGEWCVLVEQHKDFAQYNRAQADRWAELLRDAVAQNVKLGIHVGIYPEQVPFAELSRAYKMVQRELHLSPRNSNIVVAESAQLNNSGPDSLWNLIEEILSGLKQTDRRKVNKALQDLNAGLMAISATSLTRVEQILHFLIIHLLREMRELDVVTIKEEEKLWEELRHTVGTKDLIAVINRLIDQCLEVVMNKKSGEILMLNAKDYIDRNLATDLGIEEIADYLKISCSYFSFLFKMHFGETFVEYVTRQRMEMAKSLLNMTDKSIAQIGKLCGYAERRYFTKVFQKYAGMPPSEFRQKE